MLKAIAVIAILLATGLAIVLVLALTKPDQFSVERSLVIKAPAATIYPLVADFHRWTGWSPYEDRDPAMTRTYGGAAQGRGATYAWDGNSNVGAGRMEILEANAPSLAAHQARFRASVRRPQQGRVQLRAAGRCHARDVDHALPGAAAVQGHAGLHQPWTG